MKSSVCYKEVPSPALSMLSVLVLTFIGVIAVIGNGLILAAFIKDPLKQLRTPFNFLVMNLAIGDLVVGCVADPIALATHIKDIWTGKAHAGNTASHAGYFIFFISLSATLLNVCALSIDRFLAVRHPLAYRATFTERRSKTIILIIWTVALIFASVYFAFGRILTMAIYANFTVGITAVVMSTTMLMLRKEVARRERTVSMRRSPATPMAVLNRRIADARSKTRQMTVLVAILIASFLLCFIPVVILVNVLQFCTNCSCEVVHWLSDLAFLFSSASTAINPFLYTWKVKNFRKAMTVMLNYNNRQNKVACESNASGNTPKDRKANALSRGTSETASSVVAKKHSTVHFSISEQYPENKSPSIYE